MEDVIDPAQMQDSEQLFTQLEELVRKKPDFIQYKIQDILTNPQSETYITKIFELADLIGKFESQKIQLP
jgi:hypothetical protein